MTSEDIRNRKWTEEEIAAVERIAKRQAAGDDSDINYEDIPKLTDEQWGNAIRFRDRFRERNKVAVSVRLDPAIIEWLKSKGTTGYLTRINTVLANVMEAERSQAQREVVQPLSGDIAPATR